MQQSRKLYFVGGTVWFRGVDWISVMDSNLVLYYVETNKNLLPGAQDGDVVWLIYSMDKLNRKIETIIPFLQAKEEDLRKDFSEERTPQSGTNSKGSSNGTGKNRKVVKQES